MNKLSFKKPTPKKSQQNPTTKQASPNFLKKNKKSMLPIYGVESIGTDNKSTTILIKLETFEQSDQEKNL